MRDKRNDAQEPVETSLAPGGMSEWQREYWRAVRLREEGRPDEAIAMLHRLRASARDEEHRGLCALSETRCLTRPGHTKEARLLLREATRLLPALPEYKLRLGLADESIDEVEERFKEALNKLNRLAGRFRKLLKSPDLRDLYEYIQVSRGMLMGKLLRYREARPLLEEAMEFQGERGPQFLCELGICYVHLGEYEKGKKVLLGALEKSPEGSWAVTTYYSLGLAEARLGAYARAVQELEKSERLAVAHGTPTGRIHHALAVVWRQLGREDQAAHYEALSKQA